MKNIIFLFVNLILLSCANFVAPTGGKQDKQGPELIESYPENGTLNFNKNEIILKFNELIDASSLQSDLYIIPKPKGNFETKIKNNQVILKFDKPFDDSTTYTFNFKNSIKDLSEKNPSKNLKLVFSTYNKIDSLTLEGQIINLENKLPVYNTTVGLYINDTLSLKNKLPLYFTKTDSNGLFKIENIKNNKYFLLAFTDKNNNLHYNQDAELMGFIKDTLVLNSSLKLDPLEIYKADWTKPKIKRTQIKEKEYTLQFDKPLFRANYQFYDPIDSTFIYPIINKNEITFYKMVEEISKDTIRISVILQDSLLRTDTLTQKIYFKKTEETKKRKQQTFSIFSDIKTNQIQTTHLSYNLKFSIPLKKTDINKIQFKTDTSYTEKPNVQIINKNHIQIAIETKAKKQVELHIPSNIFENIYGDTNSTMKIINPILQNDELGLIEGSLKSNDTTISKIAYLYQDDTNQLFDNQLFMENFLFKNIPPGSYNIKIILDTNKNGIWDPGNIENKSLPEKIVTNKNPIRVRANYEIRNLILE